MKLNWDTGVIITGCPAWFKRWVADNYNTYVSHYHSLEIVEATPSCDLSNVSINTQGEYGFIDDTVAYNSTFPEVRWESYRKKCIEYTTYKEVFMAFLRKKGALGEYKTGLSNAGKDLDSFMEDVLPTGWIMGAFSLAASDQVRAFWEDLHTQWVVFINKLEEKGIDYV